MKTNYYYLVAGLPELSITANVMPYSLLEFRQEVGEKLEPEDQELLRSLYAPIDNANLIHLLADQKDAFDPDGNYSQEDLQSGMSMPETLPVYMESFLIQYGDQLRRMGEQELETALFNEFVDWQYALPNDFLQQWFEFNNNIRNLIAALNCSRFNLDLQKQVVGNYDIPEIIRKSRDRDFGLGSVLPYAEAVVSYFDSHQLLLREQQIEQLRWDKLDELIEPYDFTIEVILAYAAKLRIIHRNIQIPEAEGKAVMEGLLAEIRKGNELPETFESHS